MNIKELLEYGRNNLIEKEEPYRLSKILLKYLLKVEDSNLIINQDETVNTQIEEEYKKLIELLNTGKPIQYITHQQEFMKMDFYVDESVLIPQPDTEILVEEIIKICKERRLGRSEKGQTNYILDLCTGSGAIGISLAKNIENAKVIMLDISKEALEIAKKNAEKNNVIDKCNFVLSNLFDNINTRNNALFVPQNQFDIIVSNPPYIQTDMIQTLSKEVQNEPIIALDGGKDGLEFYRKIVKHAHQYLKQNGILALEIGYNQKEQVIQLLKQNGSYEEIYFKKDLAGNDRVVIANKKQ